MWPIVTDRVAWSVDLWVCLSVCHSSEPCKNGWTDLDAIWVEDSVGPKEPLLDGGPDPSLGMGNLERERGVHCKVPYFL